MPATPSRDDAVAHVYELILDNAPESARDSAQAILLLDQAEVVRVDAELT